MNRKTKRPDRILFYKDSKGAWRWRRIAPNGHVIGASTEGYYNRRDLLINVVRQARSWVFA